jgi:hypothetical protein
MGPPGGAGRAPLALGQRRAVARVDVSCGAPAGAPPYAVGRPYAAQLRGGCDGLAGQRSSLSLGWIAVLKEQPPASIARHSAAGLRHGAAGRRHGTALV